MFGAVHRRRLYMAESGEDVRGEDVVEAPTPQPFTLRFHLHPDVNVNLQQDGEAVLLRLRSGGGWRLRADGARISLEESIYLGGHEPRRSEQVVLTGYADGPQQVKWAISKVGSGSVRHPTSHPRVKIIEITNVDFSLRQFLLPLMRAIRARGHEVIGVCAEGPLLDERARRRLPRSSRLPLERSVSPLAHWRAFRALVRLFRAERPDLVHAHMPISGFLARMAAWWAGVPRIAYTVPRLSVQLPQGSWPRAAVGFAMEWLAARVTDMFLTVVDGGSTRCAATAHPSRRRGDRQRSRLRRVFHPDPAVRERVRAELGVPEERGGGGRGVAAGLAQGLSANWRPPCGGAGRDAMGRRRAAGPPIAAPTWRALLRDAGLGDAATPAGLSGRRAGAAGGGRHLRAAEPFRGPADVGDRGDADRSSGCRHRTCAARASRWCRK